MQKNFGKDTSKKPDRDKKSSKKIEAKTDDNKQKSYNKKN